MDFMVWRSRRDSATFRDYEPHGSKQGREVHREAFDTLSFRVSVFAYPGRPLWPGLYQLSAETLISMDRPFSSMIHLRRKVVGISTFPRQRQGQRKFLSLKSLTAHAAGIGNGGIRSPLTLHAWHLSNVVRSLSVVCCFAFAGSQAIGILSFPPDPLRKIIESRTAPGVSPLRFLNDSGGVELSPEANTTRPPESIPLPS
jgi:hypothetical protein